MQKIFQKTLLIISLIILSLVTVNAQNTVNDAENSGQGFIHTFGEAPEDINEVIEIRPQTLSFTRAGQTKTAEVYYIGNEPIIGAELFFEMQGLEITKIEVTAGSSLYENMQTKELHIGSLDEIQPNSKLAVLTVKSVGTDNLANMSVDNEKSTLVGKNISIDTPTTQPTGETTNSPIDPISPDRFEFPTSFALLSVGLNIILIIVVALLMLKKNSNSQVTNNTAI